MRRARAFAVRFFERVRDIDRDIDADLIDQTQRAHWHPPLDKGFVNFVRAYAVFVKLRRLEQVGEKDAINEKARDCPARAREVFRSVA